MRRNVAIFDLCYVLLLSCNGFNFRVPLIIGPSIIKNIKFKFIFKDIFGCKFGHKDFFKYQIYVPQYSCNARVHGTHPDWQKSKKGGLLNTNIC